MCWVQFFTPEECYVYRSEHNQNHAPFGGAELNSSVTSLDIFRASSGAGGTLAHEL
jgi:hypothetical protein